MKMTTKDELALQKSVLIMQKIIARLALSHLRLIKSIKTKSDLSYEEGFDENIEKMNEAIDELIAFNNGEEKHENK